MKITEIKQIGKSSKYKIFLNLEYAFTLELEIIYKFHLKEGLFLEDDQIEEIRNSNDKLTCSTIAIAYITKGLKTEKQLRDYLLRKQYLPRNIDETISKLKDYGYLNDEYFAKAYTDYAKSTKGKNLIKKELKNKGISDEHIVTSLEEIDEQTEEIKNLISKKIKNYSLPLDLKTKEKLIRFLISRGFNYSEIKSALNEFLIEIDEYNG